MKNLKWIIPIVVVIAIIVAFIGYGVINTEKTDNNQVNNENESVTNVETNTQTSNNTNTEDNNNKEATNGKTLIAYYSLTDRTERVAKIIQEVTGGDLYKIETVRSYPDEVMDVSAEARKERESGNLPDLKGELPNIDEYDLIIVGGPVWSSTVSTPLMSFLEKMDFKGKTVAPYWTDDGMPGHVETDFKSQAKNANVLKGVGITDVSEMSDSQIKSEIENWVNQIEK